MSNNQLVGHVVAMALPVPILQPRNLRAQLFHPVTATAPQLEAGIHIIHPVADLLQALVTQVP